MSSGTVTPFTDFSGNSNDTNENNSASIQPIADGEGVNATVSKRPSENLRQRTEAIRSRQVDSFFVENADRKLVVAGPGKVTWPGSTTVAASGIPTLSDTLWLLPMLTPGFAQTPPVPPVASTFGVIHLKRATGPSNAIAVTSQRRSYAAGDQINVTVTAGTPFSCVLDVEDAGTLRRTIKIVATPTTTCGDVITALNALTPPAPDNTALVSAALEGGAISGDLVLTSQAKQYMSGNYDGEGHAITPANLASFFASNPSQALAEGDSLCVRYDMLFDTASNGGRRQSIPENSNTAVPAASYFNSRVHPEYLFNALPICKVVSGALVFSTGIEVPAGSSNVGLSATDSGSRVMRNGNFEHGVTTDTTRYGITDWENRPDLAVNGAWRLNTTTPDTGGKHLEFNKTNVAASTARIQQEKEVAVSAGQFIRVACRVRQLIAPTAGTYSVVLYWGDADSAASSSSSVALQVLSTTDGAYRTVDQTIAVPSGKRFLKTVALEVAAVTSGSTGVALLVDNLQVYVETPTGQTPAVDTMRLQARTMDAIVLEDPATYALGALAALLRFDKSTPSGEGQVVLERKDQVSASLPPALQLFGRILSLGANLIGSEANALKPRVDAPVATGANINYTLLWQSVPSGLKGIRIYAGDLDNATVTQPGILITVNASFDGTNWNKDVNATESMAVYLNALSSSTDGFFRLLVQSSPNSWAPSAWEENFNIGYSTGALFARLLHNNGGVSTGELRVVNAVLNEDANGNVQVPIIESNLGLHRRAPLWTWEGDAIQHGVRCPHGFYFYPDTRLIEEDFNGVSVGEYLIGEDIAGTGAITTNGDGFALIATGGTTNNITIVRHRAIGATWGSGGGSEQLGFRARIKITDVTSTEQYIGYWSAGVAGIDSNSSLPMAFKIVNGVVSVISDGGAQVTATGVTVAAAEIRWFSLNFDPVDGVVEWHISGSGGSLSDGYVSGTYGNVSSTADAGDPAYPVVGVKTTTGSAASISVDYFAAWAGNRHSE